MSFSSRDHKIALILMTAEDRACFEANNSFESFKLNLMLSPKQLKDFPPFSLPLAVCTNLRVMKRSTNHKRKRERF